MLAAIQKCFAQFSKSLGKIGQYLGQDLTAPALRANQARHAHPLFGFSHSMIVA